MQNEKRAIIALDNMSVSQSVILLDKIKHLILAAKVGFEMFVAEGPQFLRLLREMGVDFFLDLKFHDIPNTVKKAVARAVLYEPLIINVHASGGEAMMKAAMTGAEEGAKFASQKYGHSVGRPLIVAVTLLTSLEVKDLLDIGYLESDVLGLMPEEARGNLIPELTLTMSILAERAGLDGVVCSVSDAKLIRQTQKPGFKIITPGIRRPDSSKQDQKRVATPTDAALVGAWPVIGRIVTEAADPVAAMQRVNDEIASALKTKSRDEESPSVMGGEQEPMCPDCGHTTIRNGLRYKCLNCGRTVLCPELGREAVN